MPTLEEIEARIIENRIIKNRKAKLTGGLSVAPDVSRETASQFEFRGADFTPSVIGSPMRQVPEFDIDAPEEPTGAGAVLRNAVRDIGRFVSPKHFSEGSKQILDEVVAGNWKRVNRMIGEMGQAPTDWIKVLAHYGSPGAMIHTSPEIKESLRRIGLSPLTGPATTLMAYGGGSAIGSRVGQLRASLGRSRLIPLAEGTPPKVARLKAKLRGEPLENVLGEVLDFGAKPVPPKPKITISPKIKPGTRAGSIRGESTDLIPPLPKTPSKIIIDLPEKGRVRPVQEPVTFKKIEQRPIIEQPVEATGKVARLNKADTDLIRKETKLEELPEHEVRTWKVTLAEARETGQVTKAVDTASEVINSKRPVTDVEHAGMTIRLAELKNEYTKAIADVAKEAEKGNRVGVVKEQGKLDTILDQIDALTEARRLGGREAARALAIGRMGIDIKTYDIASVMQRATASKGKKLTPKETQSIQDIAKKYEAVEKRVKDLEAKNDAIIAENERLVAERIANIETQKAKITTRTQKAKQKIVADRAGIKKQIAALGLRVSDITGVTPEAAHLIGKLAISYIKEGVTTLDAVVKRVLVDLPDLGKRDVYKALNTKDPKSIKRVRNEATTRVANLKKQAKLLLDIENAEKGVFEPSARKALSIPLEIKTLQKKLRELRKQAYDTVQKSDKLENAVRTINELQDQLDNYYRNVKAKRQPPMGELKELRGKVADLRKQMRVQDEIISLEDQLRTGDFKIAEPKKITPDSPELAIAKVELSLLRKKVDARVSRMAPLTVGKVVQEAVNTLRTFKATGDISATGRQGLILGMNTNPKVMAKIQAKALRAAKDPLYAEQLDMELRSRPNHYLGEKSGLHLTEHESANVLAKEEMFMSDVAERIPVVGKVVRASNRHMVSYLNQLRAHNFDWFAENFPNATHAELTAWADATNVWSGRGNLGSFAKAANTLSLGFFAPRFAVSRIQSPYIILKNLKIPRVRKVIAKDMTRTLAAAVSILKMADMLGADVEWTNFNSPDWGKIKIGNTRIDILGGLQQPMRLTLKLATGGSLNPADDISRFTMYKTSPLFTVPLEFYRGKTIVGQPVEPTETAVRAVMPMVAEDFQDAFEDAGLGMALLSGGLNFIGISANTYRRRRKKKGL